MVVVDADTVGGGTERLAATTTAGVGRAAPGRVAS